MSMPDANGVPLRERLSNLRLNLRWWQWGLALALGVAGGSGSVAELLGGVVGATVLVWCVVMAVRAGRGIAGRGE